MLHKTMTTFVLSLMMAPSFAFQCYLTVAKDPCWSDYNVTVKVYDYASKKKIVPDLLLPKGKQWVREAFQCQPKQGFYYQATYSPNIWNDKQASVFTSKRIWYLPEKINPKKEVAWNIPICYQTDFASVPLPPRAKGNCRCDFTSIPKIDE